jgi:hypothetical protein
MSLVILMDDESACIIKIFSQYFKRYVIKLTREGDATTGDGMLVSIWNVLA